METWAIVVLVVGTNLGTALLALLGIKKQLKHSDNRFAKELEAKREADEHNRKWVVRSQPLLKLREEIAHMAERLEFSVDLAIQVIEGVTPNQDKIERQLEKTVEEWSEYIGSGDLYKALHMQYQHELKVEGHKIVQNYQSTYKGIMVFWRGGKADEEIRKANDILRNNSREVSAFQSKINELLEAL